MICEGQFTGPGQLIFAATAQISGTALRTKPIAGGKPARVRGAGIDVAATLDEIGTPAEESMYERMRTTIRDLIGLSEITEILVIEMTVT